MENDENLWNDIKLMCPKMWWGHSDLRISSSKQKSWSWGLGEPFIFVFCLANKTKIMLNRDSLPELCPLSVCYSILALCSERKLASDCQKRLWPNVTISFCLIPWADTNGTSRRFTSTGRQIPIPRSGCFWDACSYKWCLITGFWFKSSFWRRSLVCRWLRAQWGCRLQ